MLTIQELMAQKAALEAQIAAEKPAAIQQVRELMASLGVTLQDLGAPAAATTTAPYRSKRPVKYRDANGNTWTGVGQRPRWLVTALAAGATLESFGVGKK